MINLWCLCVLLLAGHSIFNWPKYLPLCLVLVSDQGQGSDFGDCCFSGLKKLNLLFLIDYNFDSENRDTNTMLSEIFNGGTTHS